MKYTLIPVAFLLLSGCLVVEPSEYLVGTQDGKNIYEYDVVRYGSLFGREQLSQIYQNQLDGTARQLCPEGYEVLSETLTTRVFVSGPTESPIVLVRVACPA